MKNLLLKKLILTLTLLFVINVAFSQEAPIPVTWMTLKYVTFAEKWNKDIEANYLFPTFEERVKKLAGKKIEISGYIVPYSLDDGTFVLSAKPNADCFFCGKAGPESVISLKLGNSKKKFSVDDYVKVTGTLRLNSTSVYDLYYILENAEIVK